MLKANCSIRSSSSKKMNSKKWAKYRYCKNWQRKSKCLTSLKLLLNSIRRYLLHHWISNWTPVNLSFLSTTLKRNKQSWSFTTCVLRFKFKLQLPWSISPLPVTTYRIWLIKRNFWQNLVTTTMTTFKGHRVLKWTWKVVRETLNCLGILWRTALWACRERNS